MAQSSEITARRMQTHLPELIAEVQTKAGATQVAPAQ
jgi:hypothetical protein